MVNGTKTIAGCSDARDSTGYYIYRKNGKRFGECIGMDFNLAKREYQGNGSCAPKAKVCKDALLRPCVCFVCYNFLRLLPLTHVLPLRAMSYLYDAIYTLTSGLHELLEKEKMPREDLKENGILLRETMQTIGLPDGITGSVSFERGNPDRKSSDVQYNVFNFQDRGFVRLGVIKDDVFKLTCEESARPALPRGPCPTFVHRGLCTPCSVGLLRLNLSVVLIDLIF